RIELRADDLRRDDFRGIELLEQAADDRRLPGADLARDDDEPFALIQPVFEIRERPLMPAAPEEERWVRVELKGLSGKFIEGFVHGPLPERVGESREHRGLGIAHDDVRIEFLVADCGGYRGVRR